MRVTEVKRHLDGRVERFACRLVLRRPHVAVLRFDHERSRRVGGVRIPAGSVTHGFFWPRRPYILYRIAGPSTSLRAGPLGDVLAHRFDVVEAVRMGDREVTYTDLLLDLWVPAGALPRLEDEADVAGHARHGRLSPAQRRRIERTRELLLRRHATIAREAARLLAEAPRR